MRAHRFFDEFERFVRVVVAFKFVHRREFISAEYVITLFFEVFERNVEFEFDFAVCFGYFKNFVFFYESDRQIVATYVRRGFGFKSVEQFSGFFARFLGCLCVGFFFCLRGVQGFGFFFRFRFGFRAVLFVGFVSGYSRFGFGKSCEQFGVDCGSGFFSLFFRFDFRFFLYGSNFCGKFFRCLGVIFRHVILGEHFFVTGYLLFRKGKSFEYRGIGRRFGFAAESRNFRFFVLSVDNLFDARFDEGVYSRFLFGFTLHFFFDLFFRFGFRFFFDLAKLFIEIHRLLRVGCRACGNDCRSGQSVCKVFVVVL